MISDTGFGTLRDFYHREKWFILIISAAILIFNYNVFSIDILIQDDYAYVGRLLDWGYEWEKIFQRDILGPIINYFFVNIMVVSPGASRFLIVLLFMVPTSLILYYVYVEKFGIPKSVGILSAIIPQIHPAQKLIPFFINGSYVTYAMFFNSIFLFYLMSLKDHFSKKQFAVYISLVFLCIEISETTLFLYPSYTFLIFIFYLRNKNLKKFLCTLGPLVVAALYRVGKTLLFPAGANNITPLDWSGVEKRIESASLFLINSANELGLYILLIIMALLLFKLFFRKEVTVKKNGTYLLLPVEVILFGTLWFFFSILPFILISPWFASRHAYIASFGFYLILFYLLLPPIQSLMKLNDKKTAIGCMFLVLSFGYIRIESVNNEYRISNLVHKELLSTLSRYKLEENAQIVVTGTRFATTMDFHHWSSGYFKYITTRGDIDGLIGVEIKNYDPFKPYIWGKNEQKMYGLDINRPTYLFRVLDNRFEEIFYFFRWTGEKNSGIWELYKISKVDRRPKLIKRGENDQPVKKELKSYINSNQLDEEKILWLDTKSIPLSLY